MQRLKVGLHALLPPVLPEGLTEIDLGLYEEALPLSDELRFAVLQRALDSYTWPEEGELTWFRQQGLLQNLVRAGDREARFAEWCVDHPEGDKELFARDMLIAFLELLVPSFPGGLQLKIVLEKALYDFPLFLRLAHPGRCAGMTSLCTGEARALLLPPAEVETLSEYHHAAEMAERLSLSCFLAEEELPQAFAGLSEVYITRYTSPRARRMLQGFCAAEGIVHNIMDMKTFI